MTREEIVKELERARAAYNYNAFAALTEAIEILTQKPKSEPEQRKGKWIDIDAETYTWMIKCDKCGHLRSMMSMEGRYPRFCENCGAEMEGQDG